VSTRLKPWMPACAGMTGTIRQESASTAAGITFCSREIGVTVKFPGRTPLSGISGTRFPGRAQHFLVIEAAIQDAIIDLDRHGFGPIRTFDHYRNLPESILRRHLRGARPADDWPYTTPVSCSLFSASGSTSQSDASTSSVCSPSKGGRVISAGESDSLIGQPTV